MIFRIQDGGDVGVGAFLSTAVIWIVPPADLGLKLLVKKYWSHFDIIFCARIKSVSGGL